MIEEAIRKSFISLGFSVTGKSTSAKYIAKAEVNYSKSEGSKMIVMNPYLTLSLIGKKGSIYTFSTESEKVVAPNEQAAKKIATNDIVKKINQKLETDIKNSLGL